MSFDSLRKQSKLGSLTDKLVKEVEKMNSSPGSTDDRYWKAELDKTGVGSATVRFLPAPDGEELPWVKVYSHAFQGPGGWYIENSLTTINKKDPVGDVNRSLWNTGSEADKETARRQKRKLSYFTNIYVVADPKHPEHEGKVFLYKFGKKIFDKIMEAMQPQFDDEQAINPFDLWKGANFKLKIRKVDGFWNYDKSEFEAVTQLLPTDEELEKIYGSEYPLKPFHDESNFKSYGELKEKMERVLGEAVDNRTAEQVASDMDVVSDPPFDGGKPITGEASDTMEYFEKLATA